MLNRPGRCGAGDVGTVESIEIYKEIYYFLHYTNYRHKKYINIY